MSKISERLLAIQQSKEKLSFEVEGLGQDGQPLIVYYSKLTVREDEKLRRLHPNFYDNVMNGSIPTMNSLVDLICLKAENEDGTKLFDEDDKLKLRGMDVAFIMKFATNMLGDLFDEPTLEQAEKNL
jgi:hypothetical protein